MRWNMICSGKSLKRNCEDNNEQNGKKALCRSQSSHIIHSLIIISLKWWLKKSQIRILTSHAAHYSIWAHIVISTGLYGYYQHSQANKIASAWNDILWTFFDIFQKRTLETSFHFHKFSMSPKRGWPRISYCLWRSIWIGWSIYLALFSPKIVP